MIARALACVLASLMLVACGGERRGALVPNEIATIRLDEAGETVLRFEVDRPALAAFDLFAAPDAIGAVTSEIRPDAPEGEAIDTRLTALAPGRYRLALASEGAGPSEIQARLRLEPPLDAFEPNDSPETAEPVALPFRAVIQLANAEPDWFEIRPDAGTVVGIRLVHSASNYRGPIIEVRGETGEVLFRSADEPWGWGAMRYVEATGGVMHVGVWESWTFNPGDPRSLKGIEIVTYADAPYPAGTFVTLGLGEDETAFTQLALAGRAAGLTVARTEEADAIAREFAGAIGRGRPARDWLWAGLALTLAFAIGSGIGWILRARHARR